jgi:hypothetical protein
VSALEVIWDEDSLVACETNLLLTHMQKIMVYSPKIPDLCRGYFLSRKANCLGKQIVSGESDELGEFLSTVRCYTRNDEDEGEDDHEEDLLLKDVECPEGEGEEFQWDKPGKPKNCTKHHESQVFLFEKCLLQFLAKPLLSSTTSLTWKRVSQLIHSE